MLMLPVAWMRKADHVSYALLVLASMGIMGCDGELRQAGCWPLQLVLALPQLGYTSRYAGHAVVVPMGGHWDGIPYIATWC